MKRTFLIKNYLSGHLNIECKVNSMSSIFQFDDMLTVKGRSVHAIGLCIYYAWILRREEVIPYGCSFITSTETS